MDLILQKHKYGCGPACIAMIMNISYSRALRLLHPWRIPFTCPETPYVKIIEFLDKMKFNTEIYVWQSNIPFSILDHHAMIVIYDFDVYHGVVWDADQQRILEPFDGIVRDNKYYQEKAVRVVEVWK